ncbi:HAD family hydrolase [Massilia sp. CCM 9210]|uniref:HAD family hydrolase n=1 Tax=Massilia scottii TaxID=3057166 RepID=UPI002796914F|nr:HAD family hydrolase [Massilia sp. CCM 9210]MDQ1812036.1 HAD family hydrolase [Massilia sp. CCM 9210]
MHMVKTDRCSTAPVTCTVVLATDLDGILPAGSPETPRHICDLFSGGLPWARIVFVPPRRLKSFMPVLIDSTMPRPHYIIADIGATVVYGDLRLMQPLQDEIARRWPGLQALVRAVARSSLQRQCVLQERHCSGSLARFESSRAKRQRRLAAGAGSRATPCAPRCCGTDPLPAGRLRTDRRGLRRQPDGRADRWQDACRIEALAKEIL